MRVPASGRHYRCAAPHGHRCLRQALRSHPWGGSTL